MKNGVLPFQAIKVVLRELVDVDGLIPDESEVEATAQAHLPQLLGSLVGVQTAMAQQKAHCQRKDEI